MNTCVNKNTLVAATSFSCVVMLVPKIDSVPALAGSFKIPGYMQYIHMYAYTFTYEYTQQADDMFNGQFFYVLSMRSGAPVVS